jgi:polar amino acid transport system substrate-binding protein
MRRFAVIGVVAAITIGAAACGDSDKSESSASTTTAGPSAAGPCGDTKKPAAAATFRPVRAGTLSVITNLPGPGFWEGSETDATKLTAGFEYHVAQCLQQMFGLANFAVRDVPFREIETGTATDYDVALAQVSITPERANVVSFSVPYFESQPGILMPSSESITTLDEAKRASWGVQSGTTSVELLRRIGVDNPRSWANLADAYAALRAGEIDAVLTDGAINLGEAAGSDGELHVTAQFAQPGGPERYGIVLPKGSANVGAVNAVIKAMRDSGQLTELVTQDLAEDPGTIPVIEVPRS